MQGAHAAWTISASVWEESFYSENSGKNFNKIEWSTPERLCSKQTKLCPATCFLQPDHARGGGGYACAHTRILEAKVHAHLPETWLKIMFRRQLSWLSNLQSWYESLFDKGCNGTTYLFNFDFYWKEHATLQFKKPGEQKYGETLSYKM